MQSLAKLISNLHPIEKMHFTDRMITGLELDSRKVAEGNMFFAIRGTQVDGHKFMGSATAKGASAIICEEMPSEPKEGIAYIRVADSAQAMGEIAATFYERPSDKMKLVGITGTNGKTSIVSYLFDLFTSMGYKCGMLSTVGNRIAEKQLSATHTTPDSISIQRLMADMVDAGCSHVFMEVSSHAVHQKRIAGLNFDGGVFTNITHDHLDYHITFDAYLKAKKQFFDDLPKSAFVLTNKDDKNGSVFLQNTIAKPYYYSVWNKADFKAKILDSGWAGLHLQIDGQEVFTRITGEFNAYNLLAAYGVAILLEEIEEDVLKALSNLQPPPGRFEIVHGKERRIGIVDYAHTPDALEKVIEMIREMRNPGQKIITVIGCGGNRDKDKRPEMARIAATKSDLAIFTSDNPRDEDPMTILAEMEAGITGELMEKSITIPDRKEAIITACQLANSNDIVAVAGKGHEDYQEIKGQRLPFDDKKILTAEL